MHFIIIQKNLLTNKMKLFLFNSFVVERATVYFKCLCTEVVRIQLHYILKHCLSSNPVSQNVPFSSNYLFIAECLLCAALGTGVLLWPKQTKGFAFIYFRSGRQTSSVVVGALGKKSREEIGTWVFVILSRMERKSLTDRVTRSSNTGLRITQNVCLI